MKVIIVVYLTLATAHAELDRAFKEQKLKEIQEIIDDCQKIEMSTRDDLAEIYIDKPMTRNGAKCLWSCIIEALGIQDENGKISLDGALRSIECYKVDENIYDKLKTVNSRCIEKGKFYECHLIEFKEVGLPYKFMDI